jgi:hypothetical protein
MADDLSRSFSSDVFRILAPWWSIQADGIHYRHTGVCN